MQVIDGGHHSAIAILIHRQVTCRISDFIKVFLGGPSLSMQYSGETKSKEQQTSYPEYRGPTT